MPVVSYTAFAAFEFKKRFHWPGSRGSGGPCTSETLCLSLFSRTSRPVNRERYKVLYPVQHVYKYALNKDIAFGSCQSALTSRKITAAKIAVTTNAPPIRNPIGCPSFRRNYHMLCLLINFTITESKFRDDA